MWLHPMEDGDEVIIEMWDCGIAPENRTVYVENGTVLIENIISFGINMF